MTTRCKKIVRYNQDEDNILGSGEHCPERLPITDVGVSTEARKPVEPVRLRACRQHVDEQLGGHEHSLI